MTHRIKTVIWDMGGVILRSMDWTSRKQLAKEHSLTLDGIYELVFSSESAKQATLGEIDELTHWKNLGESLRVDEEGLRKFQDLFWKGDNLDQELVNFIRSLKPSFTTALLSNAWSGARKVLTKTRPCIDAFHVSVFSCEVRLAKPDPEIYKYLLRLCGSEPNEAIFVDDFLENVVAANNLGIHGIQFKNSDQAIREVKNLLELE